MKRKNEVEVLIRGRKLKVAIDGLTDIEVVSLAGDLEKKLNEIEKKTDIVDTSKIAIYAAFEYAAQVYNFRRKSENENSAVDAKLDAMLARLEKHLKEKGGS